MDVHRLVSVRRSRRSRVKSSPRSARSSSRSQGTWSRRRCAYSPIGTPPYACTICVGPACMCSPWRPLPTGTRGGSAWAQRRVRRRCDTPLECPSELAAGGARQPSDRYGAALYSSRGSRTCRGARRPASAAAVQPMLFISFVYTPSPSPSPHFLLHHPHSQAKVRPMPPASHENAGKGGRPV